MNVLILFSLVLYGVAATPIGTKNDNQRIVNGFDASVRQFPYQASIRNESMKHFCNGAIISNKWILTSCFCATLLEANKMKVVVGSIYRNGGTTHDVVTAIKHPDCDLDLLSHDIGLILVKGIISFNDFTRSIELNSGDTPEDVPLTASGWGTKTIWSITPPNTLQYVNLRALSLDTCRKVFRISDAEMCTYKYNHDKQGLCLFDQGDPLVYKGKLHGIASQTNYCILLLPDVHTRVSSYRDWIRDISDV